MRTTALVSAEDFARIAPILGPCELVKGEVVPLSPGGMRHSKVTGRAFLLLAKHVEARGLGHVLTGEAGVIVGRHRRRSVHLICAPTERGSQFFED